MLKGILIVSGFVFMLSQNPSPLMESVDQSESQTVRPWLEDVPFGSHLWSPKTHGKLEALKTTLKS